MTLRSFTVRGSRNGSLVHVTWTEGGILTGDPPTVDLLYVQAEVLDSLRDDAIGVRAYPDLVRDTVMNPLTDSSSAHHLITYLLDSIRETSGDHPEHASSELPRTDRDNLSRRQLRSTEAGT